GPGGTRGRTAGRPGRPVREAARGLRRRRGGDAPAAPVRGLPARADGRRAAGGPGGAPGRGAALRELPPDPRTHDRVRAVSRRLVVEADGGSRGNPGPAGYGAVVLDAGTGEVLAERA